MINELFKNTKAFLFDLDGTVYFDEELIGDAAKTLSAIRDKGIRIVYLSNNSSKTDDEYYDKLKRIGILDERDIFYSSLDATVDYIAKNMSNEKIYACATSSVRKYLADKGVNLVEDDKQATAVLTTFDKELTYEKIVKVNTLLKRGVKYLATHPDSVCPTKDGDIPDLGSFTQMFFASSGRNPDVIIGKPYCYMAEEISAKLKLDKRQITMVGDRLYTDIAFGVNADFNTILVFSGETTPKMYADSKIKADVTLKDINEIVKYL